MKRIFFVSFIIVAFVSCSMDFGEDEPPFYKFTNSDYEYIPTAYEEVGKVFAFKNQLNADVINLRVLDYYFEKASGGGMSFTQSYSEYYYYQRLWITIGLEDLGGGGCEGNSIRFSIFKNKNGSVWDKIIFPTSPNPCSAALLWFKSPFEDFNELTVNDVNYRKVKVITTENAFSFYDNSKIKKIYYDLKEGVIGFDDLDGKEWRLVN